MRDSSSILLSISPEYASKISSGEKLFELRRRAPRVPDGTRVWIYSTMPIGAVTTTAQVRRIITKPVDELWREVEAAAGVSKAEFDAYFEGLATGSALELESAQGLAEPVSLRELRALRTEFHPPQFYLRLPQHSAELRALSQRRLLPSAASELLVA